MSMLTREEANRIIAEKGYFAGLQHLVDRYGLSMAKTIEVRSGLFKYLQEEVKEAQREVAHIQTALSTMHSTCTVGAARRMTSWKQMSDPDVLTLINACRQLEGWTISLLESMVSLESGIMNPDTAGALVKSLQPSFADLWRRRVQDNYKMMNNHPDLFKVGYYYSA